MGWLVKKSEVKNTHSEVYFGLYAPVVVMTVVEIEIVQSFFFFRFDLQYELKQEINYYGSIYTIMEYIYLFPFGRLGRSALCCLLLTWKLKVDPFLSSAMLWFPVIGCQSLSVLTLGGSSGGTVPPEATTGTVAVGVAVDDTGVDLTPGLTEVTWALFSAWVVAPSGGLVLYNGGRVLGLLVLLSEIYQIRSITIYLLCVKELYSVVGSILRVYQSFKMSLITNNYNIWGYYFYCGLWSIVSVYLSSGMGQWAKWLEIETEMRNYRHLCGGAGCYVAWGCCHWAPCWLWPGM